MHIFHLKSNPKQLNESLGGKRNQIRIKLEPEHLVTWACTWGCRTRRWAALEHQEAGRRDDRLCAFPSRLPPKTRAGGVTSRQKCQKSSAVAGRCVWSGGLVGFGGLKYRCGLLLGCSPAARRWMRTDGRIGVTAATRRGQWSQPIRFRRGWGQGKCNVFGLAACGTGDDQQQRALGECVVSLGVLQNILSLIEIDLRCCSVAHPLISKYFWLRYSRNFNFQIFLNSL